MLLIAMGSMSVAINLTSGPDRGQRTDRVVTSNVHGTEKDQAAMAIKEYAKLHDLSHGSREFDLAAVLRDVLKEIKAGAPDLSFGIMTCGKTRKRYVLETKKGALRQISEEDTRKKAAPTRNWLIVGDETALEDLLRGRVSPVTLMQQGNLRYVGSESCFTSLWSMLSSPQGEVARPCDEG